MSCKPKDLREKVDSDGNISMSPPKALLLTGSPDSLCIWFLLSGPTAAGWEVGRRSPGLVRDTEQGSFLLLCLFWAQMDDVTASGSGKQGHESSMNQPSPLR